MDTKDVLAAVLFIGGAGIVAYATEFMTNTQGWVLIGVALIAFVAATYRSA